MSANFELAAELRHDLGKGASRRLRRTNKIPAILYGGHKASMPLTVPRNMLRRHLEREAFYSSIIHLKIGDETEKVVLKDLQRDPGKPFIQHLDLQRISETEKLRMHVPLHFVGEDVAPGVKQGGGRITHSLIEAEVSCLAKDLPEYLEVDLSTLNLGESVHLSDLTLPEGVELAELTSGPEHDLTVAAVQSKRGGDLDEALDEAGAED